MNKDTPIIEIETCKIITNKMELIPYSLRLGKNLSLSVIQEWIRGRALQSNRKNSDKIYSYLGLDKYEDTLKLMYMSHSLSLTDNYWIADESELNKTKYSNINLFDNQFNKDLYSVALLGKEHKTYECLTSAEYTGQGAYTKCFVKEADGVYMYKNSSRHAIYCEILSGRIASILDFSSVTYEAATFMNVECTKSRIVSGISTNWETAADLTRFFDQTEYKIPQEFMLRARTEQYCNMIAFDAIILNDDRHMKNWAFEFDADTNELIGLAPSYDYNNAFNGDKNTLNLLLFNGNRHVNILSAARIAYRDYGITLNFNNLGNYLDSYNLSINKQALKNRIKYIKGEKSNQNDCYEV